MSKNFPTMHKLLAWSVHLFTALGVLFAMLATLAVFNNQPLTCMLWLSLTLIIDGIDGTMARKANIKEVLPNFDGSILDLIVDYLTYVFIPALFIYKFIDLPQGLEFVSIAIILISSLYCFCNKNMKSSDNYFVGFPATWNIVALYFYILSTVGYTNLITIIFLALLTVTPIKFLHPFRVKKLMLLNILVSILWLITSVILAIQAPQKPILVYCMWWFVGIYFIASGLWSSWQDKKTTK